MKGRRPELDPELETFFGFRRAARRLPDDVRARVLARSRAYLSEEEPAFARVPSEARSQPPSISRHRFPDDVRARVLARSRAYLSEEEPAPATVLFEARSQPPSVSSQRRLRWLALVASMAIAAGAIAALRSRAPNLPPTDSLTTWVPFVAAVRDQTIPHDVPAILPTKHRAAMTRSHRMLQDPLAEVELLQRAQHAYASSDFLTTLVLVAEHARRFPRSPLAEEREALRVESLVSSGRGDDAFHARAAFAARFPRSVLLPRIEDALESPAKRGVR